MKTLTTIFVCLFAIAGWAQKSPAIKSFTGQKLPDGTAMPRSNVHAVQWSDKEGRHVLVTSKEAASDSIRYIVTKHYSYGRHAIAWWEGDSLQHCEPAAAADFIEPVFRLTDLDNDGVAEIWLMYRKQCTAGELAELVLVMREGANRYLFAGHEAVKNADGRVTGGDYAENSSFAAADPKFHTLAKTIWHEQTKELAE